MLRRLGADLSAKSHRGETPLAVAKGDAIRSFLEAVARGRASAAASDASGSEVAHENPLKGKQGRSAKAKREYLQWKREQKRARAQQEEDDEEEEEQRRGEAIRSEDLRQQDRRAGPAQHRRVGSMDLSSRTPSSSRLAATCRGGVGRPRPRDVEGPIARVELEALSGGNGGKYHLPRLEPADAGFSEEGIRLGMPLRPDWTAVRDDPEALQQLEEEAFRVWVDSLGRFEPGRLSFYEVRLEYWRQLWRVLERSDIAIMVVDARNPLLHFSYALYRHVTEASRPR